MDVLSYRYCIGSWWELEAHDEMSVVMSCGNLGGVCGIGFANRELWVWFGEGMLCMDVDIYMGKESNGYLVTFGKIDRITL